MLILMKNRNIPWLDLDKAKTSIPNAELLGKRISNIFEYIENFEKKINSSFKDEKESIKTIFEHKINELKKQIEELEFSHSESQLIKIRDRIIEDIKKDNLSTKQELQRVNGLYIKYKNLTGKLKKKIQDLENTTDVYYTKIANLIRQNEKLAIMTKSVMFKLDKFIDENKIQEIEDLDKETFDLILVENKQLISDIRQSIKKFKSNEEHKEHLMITNDDISFQTPDQNDSITKKKSSVLSLPEVNNSTVSVLSPQVSQLELTQKEEEPKSIFESTEVMQRLFKECVGEVCKKIKTRTNDVLRQCYYTQTRQISNISNQARFKNSDKKDIAKMMYEKLNGFSHKNKNQKLSVLQDYNKKGRNRSVL